MSRAWNDSAHALIWKIIHLQDKQTACLVSCLRRGIVRQNYGLVIRFLPLIRKNAEEMEDRANQLVAMKPYYREGGRPPKWFALAEDVLHFSRQTQRAIDKIEDEIKSNYWKVVQTRLTGCLKSCRKLQHTIISAIPKGKRITDTYWIQSTVDIMDTLDMGRTSEGNDGGRWKRTR